MRKILFYINALNGGGAERVMANLSAQFASNDYEGVLVTSYRADGEYALSERIKRITIENEEIKTSRIRRNYNRISSLRKICKIEKPDVLISFMAEPNFRSIIATCGLKTKTVISVRNDPNKEYSGRVMRFVGKWILPFADGCVFQTEDAMKWFHRGLQKKGTVILNAVKDEFFRVNREVIEGLIVSCGRLEPQKNQQLLINAIFELQHRYPSLKVKIYGEGTLYKKLENTITDLKLNNSISLEGQTTDVARALSEADMFVLTSDYEGLPNALMEAMAVGIPCISTDCPCGGPKMLLGDNGGILIPVNGLQELIDSIELLVADNDMKASLAEEAKIRAEQFSSESVFKQWENFINQLVLD